MSFDAGAITSTLGIDVSPFAHGMIQAESIAHLFPHVVTDFIANPLLALVGIAEEAGHAIHEAFEVVTESAHQLGLQAQIAGVSAKFLGMLGAAGKSTNTSIEELAHSLALMNRNAAQAAKGSKSDAAAFDELGVSVTDVAGHLKPTEQLFMEVVDAIAALPSPMQQSEAAMTLFSRGGLGLLPVLKKGSAGLRDLAGQMREAAGNSGAALVDMSDKIVHLHHIYEAAWTGIKRAVATPFMRLAADHAEEMHHRIVAAAAAVRAGIEIGFHFGEIAAVKLHQGFGVAAHFITQHATEVRGAIVGMSVAFAMMQVPAAFGVMASTLGMLKGLLVGLVSFFGAPIAIAVALGAAIGVLSAKMGWLTPAWEAVKSAGTATIGWVTGTAIPAIKSGLVSAFEFLKPAISAAGGLFVVMWNLMKQFWGWLSTVWIPMLSKGLAAAMGFPRPAWTGLANALKGSMPFWEATWNAMKFVARIISTVLVAELKVAWWWIKTVANVAATVFSKAFDIAAPVLKFFGNILGWVVDHLGRFLGQMGRAILAVQKFVGIASDATETSVPAVAAAAAPTPESVPAHAAEAAGEAAHSVGEHAAESSKDLNHLSAAADYASEAVGSGFSESASLARRQGELLGSTMSRAADIAKGPFASALNVAKGALDAWLATGNAVVDMLERMTRLAADVSEPLQRVLGNGGGALATGGSGGSSGNIGDVHVNVDFDPREASSRIVEAVLPELQRQVDNAKRDMASSMRAERLRGNL